MTIHQQLNVVATMPPSTATSLSLPERLLSFEGYWNEDEATARQLAAMGHVYDRPPLAALEEGTYCISCNAFVKREDSIATLQESLFKKSSRRDSGPKTFKFHHATCMRLQVRIPLDIHTSPGQLAHHFKHDNWSHRLEQQTPMVDSTNTTLSKVEGYRLLALPTEIKMQIYSMIIPTMDRVTSITAADREGTRLSTPHSVQQPCHDNESSLHLLRSCRAILYDAQDVLFHATTYRFESTKLMYLFLRHIGSHGRQLLRSVDVVCGSREDAIAFALLAACPKLNSITIRMCKGKLLPGISCSLWVLDGVACLLELSGLETVTFGECGFSAHLREDMHDGRIVRRELTRLRGDPSGIRWVNGFPDL
jgi:hypothetical protein